MRGLDRIALQHLNVSLEGAAVRREVEAMRAVLRPDDAPDHDTLLAYLPRWQAARRGAAPCEYFTRYGNDGVPGSCSAPATLAMRDNRVAPAIKVCREHAERIVQRFPVLGDLEQRFVPVP